MIVGPLRSQTPVLASLACGKPSLADLCSCTDDAGEQKKKKKTMQVLRRLPRLRMSRNLAPALVKTVPLRTSAASYLANGQAIRGWKPVRCSILGAINTLIMTEGGQLLLPAHGKMMVL